MSLVFDTQALLVLYLDEDGADRVAELLGQVLGGKIKGYMNIINMAELYYILGRKSPKIAEEKERNIRSFGVKLVQVRDNSLWKEAAMLKASHRLSLADAFAAATAKTLKSKLVTGDDEEFEGIDGLRIERVSA
ncbi:MAG: PIN domain-containing protein [Thaumarchaeota archaeon]|nr:PIN domain-containing protein [Nitrososphaerota archaeon]